MAMTTSFFFHPNVSLAGLRHVSARWYTGGTCEVDGRQCVATGDQVASSLHSMATRGSGRDASSGSRAEQDGRPSPSTTLVRPPPGGPAGDSRSENKSFSRAGNLSTTCEAVQNLPAVSNARASPTSLAAHHHPQRPPSGQVPEKGVCKHT